MEGQLFQSLQHFELKDRLAKNNRLPEIKISATANFLCIFSTSPEKKAALPVVHELNLKKANAL
jgi:hypothetical protein